MKAKLILLISLLSFSTSMIFSQNIITEKNEKGAFPIVTPSSTASIYVDEKDDWLAQRAATFLQKDIENVTGRKPPIISSISPSVKTLIIIGVINHSALLDKLVRQKKLIIDGLKGQWETFKIQTINTPFDHVQNALVIAGSDKRGTAYGVFELSDQMGVSPWYWWADVPVKKMKELYAKKGAHQFGPPSVKYRGIFINDEAPAFSGWAREKFGGINHMVYEKVFELLLRLRANYLWPAMWGNAFNDDDTLNPILADKYGIVMGTSHHEPMLRAQQEWKRYGKGQWNYDSNQAVLKDFWRKGIENMGKHESIVTIGMRGDGDMPMTRGTAIELLERIVADQRKIIEEVTGKPAAQTPQLWALYKEVQDYYDKGMRVPDDVTLLLCDDNWGNIRRLPRLTDKPRAGGYGIYYHFDYVGGPRNYKWINTNNIARVWEQMHLAYEYGVNRIWIVNVGDLKPMEFPISFFLEYAWNVKKWNQGNLNDYYSYWASKQFGPGHAREIGNIIQKYSQYISRRKPELLDTNTYSQLNYNEADRVCSDWNNLVLDGEKVNSQLPPEYRDAFFELVLHPVKASATVHQLYAFVARNHLLAKEHLPIANQYADLARKCYLDDSLLSIEYNHLAQGKWNHMMDQTHIGYTYWQQPPRQKMPEVIYVSDSPSNVKSGYKENVNLGGPSKDSYTNKPVFFTELDGYVSMQSVHYRKAINSPTIQWKPVPGIGKDGDGMTTFPVTAREQTVTSNSPHLEYEIYTHDTGAFTLQAYFSPTLNFHNDADGLRYGVSVDNEPPQIISINKDDNNQRTWEQWVANNIIIKSSEHRIIKPGKHVIKYWMVSPGVILQKIVVDFGGVKPSYLGPPESIYK